MTNHPPSVLWHCWLGHQTCKNRRPYNLYCVGADVKPCSINLEGMIFDLAYSWRSGPWSALDLSGLILDFCLDLEGLVLHPGLSLEPGVLLDSTAHKRHMCYQLPDRGQNSMKTNCIEKCFQLILVKSTLPRGSWSRCVFYCVLLCE